MASRTIWNSLLSCWIYYGMVDSMIFAYVCVMVTMFLLGLMCGIIIGRNEE